MASNAVRTLNVALFNHVKNQIQSLGRDLGEKWQFLEKLLDMNLDQGSIVFIEFQTTIRALLGMAIKISIFSLDFDSIMNILAFSKSQKVILCLDGGDLDMLILTNSFDVMKEMVDANMQYERVIKPKKNDKISKPKQLARQNTLPA